MKTYLAHAVLKHRWLNSFIATVNHNKAKIQCEFIEQGSGEDALPQGGGNRAPLTSESGLWETIQWLAHARSIIDQLQTLFARAQFCMTVPHIHGHVCV